MFQRILVPLDGSEHAERAIPVAAHIARATGGTLIFTTVVFSPAKAGNYSFESLADLQTGRDETRHVQAGDYLTYTVTTAYAQELTGIPIKLDVEMGAPAPTIFATALLEQVDSIIMWSHEDTGWKRLFFGSIAFEAVRHAPVPILILHENCMDLHKLTEDQPLRVLIPLDGTPLAETALEPAIQLISALAAPEPAAIHLLRVIDIPSSSGKYKGVLDADAFIRKELQQEATRYLQQLKERLHIDHPLPVISSVVINPSTATAIIEATEQEEELKGRDAIIAMATHGRTGLQHLLMGSVTEQVLKHTKLPLLVIHSHGQEAHTRTEDTK
ncbi:universal stress protein [Reticulibacter mediterranei]|uniref:Universal stress protein n=1 Tax=Reticulibacter mediterranei TaxID=2778369 RepID=A0A8J3J063_9CHLR|nr:universal stress protein [Reticulibacter mediterranei]GHO99942.1 universal stress protein [Reticulibacter mediterranei]